jgi:hypothetical protein
MMSRQPDELRDGAYCTVVGGTHAGKAGVARDIKTSKTGHVTITVEQKGGRGSRRWPGMSLSSATMTAMEPEPLRGLA